MPDEAVIPEDNDMVNPGDIIITFNWDNVLERFFEEKERKITFLFAGNDDKSIVILKLHGSIDWVKTSGEISPEMKDLLVVKDYKEEPSSNILRYREDNFLERMNKEKKEVYIIPPLAYKDERIKPLGHIWASAYTALCNIERKIFIGYSFPKEDALARVLLSSYPFLKVMAEETYSDREQIIVINPCENAELHYKRYYTKQEIEFFNTTFANYIDVNQESILLKSRLKKYQNVLETCRDKFVQHVALRIFSKNIDKINCLEKKRVEEYLNKFHNANINL